MSVGESVRVAVLVEPLGDRPGFVARAGAPFDLSAEAETPEAALQGLTRAMQHRLDVGGRLHSLAFPQARQQSAAGWLPDDELTREWQQAVEEYRRGCDEADRRRILGDTEGKGGEAAVFI